LISKFRLIFGKDSKEKILRKLFKSIVDLIDVQKWREDLKNKRMVGKEEIEECQIMI